MQRIDLSKEIFGTISKFSASPFTGFFSRFSTFVRPFLYFCPKIVSRLAPFAEKQTNTIEVIRSPDSHLEPRKNQAVLFWWFTKHIIILYAKILNHQYFVVCVLIIFERDILQTFARKLPSKSDK